MSYPSIESTLASFNATTFYSSYTETIHHYLDELITINYIILGKNSILFWNYISDLATIDNINKVTADMEKLYNSVNLNNKKALEKGYADILNKYTSKYLIQETKPFVKIACEAFGIDPSLIIYPIQ